jgi:hypothetical protein
LDGDIGTPPFRDKNYQKRIAELTGRQIQDVIGLDQIRRIVKPRAFVSKMGLKAVELSDELIVCALMTGRIVHHEDMNYHLQISSECTLEMQKGTVVLGIYYEPVGYIRINRDESYWFLFGTEEDAEQTPERDKSTAALCLSFPAALG